MDKNAELKESQLAMARFYTAVKEAGGLVQLGQKITRLCSGEQVELTVAEAGAIACSLESTIRLGNAVQLNAREHAKANAAPPSVVPSLVGTKAGQLADGIVEFN